MENDKRFMIVSAKQITSNGNHSSDKTGRRMYVSFDLSLKLKFDDQLMKHDAVITKRFFSFPLADFASAAAARAVLDPALATLFIRFSERRTIWRDRDHVPVAGLAGVSEKIAELGASMAAQSAGQSPEMLVEIWKIVPLTWPQDSPELDRRAYCHAAVEKEYTEYFDGETEEGSRLWISAEQITTTRQGNAQIGMTIELSRRVEDPFDGSVATVAAYRFTFPLADFASAAAARDVLVSALVSPGVRPPTLGTYWRESSGDDTFPHPYSCRLRHATFWRNDDGEWWDPCDDTFPHPVPLGNWCRPRRATFWRNGDGEWSPPIMGLVAAAEKIADLGASMARGGGGEILVKIQRMTVAKCPPNNRHFDYSEFADYYRTIRKMEDTQLFYDLTGLETKRYEGSEKLTCPICLSDVEFGCQVITLPCTHTFHGDCIKMWAKKSRTCPNCRSGYFVIFKLDGERIF